MILLINLLAFMFGATIGSFFALVVERLPQGLDVVFTPSHCDHCQTKLQYYDLIPIIGYFNQGGNCRFCHNWISPQSCFIEIIGGLSSCWILNQYNTYHLLGASLFLLLFYAAIFDLAYHYVDQLVLTLMFSLTIILQNRALFANLLPALVVAIVLWLLSSLTHGLGLADIELIVILVLAFGLQITLWLTLFACLFVILKYYRHHYLPNIEIAFIPFFYMAYFLIPWLPLRF
ncbi:type 4 prepilin peptidase 1 [Lapidilactobacillus concavus]|nr:type 4 prepilin peptidase 1 [Lapidilactobacillus concavus]